VTSSFCAAEQRNTLHALLTLLHTHFQKEEEKLLPLLQQHLAPEEFSTLLAEAHQVEREGKPSDINRFLDADHRRMDRIVEAFAVLKHVALRQAKTLFTHSKHGLLRHMNWEEDLLFPAFEAKTQRHDHGPTAAVRQEHTQIKAALARIEQLLDAGELQAIDVAEQELGGLLTAHNQKEEQILYPLINQSLSASERKELLDKLG